jgi:hypothetical protein
MLIHTQKSPIAVDREVLDDRDDQHKSVRRRYGADFWPMTLILTVIIVASLIALSRIAELF